MAETIGKSSAAAPPSTSAVASKKPKIPVHQIYALPAPIRTFPLPSFYPDNPLSLVHLVYAWLRQTVFSRPPNEPSKIYHGRWSPETRSVNVSDAVMVRALWEQGFFGKGSLSRSEPNWLKREMNRRGLEGISVAEQNTNKRREERLRAKWERARLEQELIERTRQEESLANGDGAAAVIAPSPHPPKPLSNPPVGPLELLRLPNSKAELDLLLFAPGESPTNGVANGNARSSSDASAETSLPSFNELHKVNGSAHQTPHKIEGLHHLLKKQKNVRFSNAVSSMVPGTKNSPSSGGGSQPTVEVKDSSAGKGLEMAHTGEVQDLEHLQLSPQEAFYLTFAIGALSVVNPETKSKLSNVELLQIFCDHAFFPPRISASTSDLRTDDTFLVHYAVYHHFRSLGWVPREGVKFGVDWLLYRRGPVFDHAEFGLVVLPSYSHPGWKDEERRHPRQQISWFWLHGTQRVLSHVLKSLVIVYVDIPPPSAINQVSDPERGIAALLAQYKVREIMVRRWSSNRNR